MSIFLCSYEYNGLTWGIRLNADNWDDAEKRAEQLNLSVDGKLCLTCTSEKLIPYRGNA